MADNAEWYARKLAAARGQAPAAPQQSSYPPVAPPVAPGQLPPHMAAFATQQYHQQPPAGTPQAPVQPTGMTQQQFTSYDATTGAQVADDGTIAALYSSAVQTGGSKAVKEGSSTCPNCNGGNYFKIGGEGQFSQSAGGFVHVMQCADCNYPQIQAGSTGGALASSRSSGGGTPARQLPSNHRVAVTMPGGRIEVFDPPRGA